MIAPTRRPGPMPFTVLMDQAMRETRRHWRPILPSVALPFALLASVVAVGTARMEALAGASAEDPSQILFQSCGFLVAIFGFLAFMGIAYTAMAVAAVDAATGRPVDMKRSWRFTLSLRVLGTLVLQGVAIIVLSMVGGIPLGVLIAIGAMQSPFLALLLGMVGALFLILLLLFLTSFMTFITPVMAEEGRFGAAALRRSMSLVLYSPHRRLFSVRPMWKVLGFLVVGTVISMLVSLLVSLPFEAPAWIDTMRKAAAGQEADPTAYLWLQVVGQFVGAIASSAVYLYVSFGVALLFFDTRGRKEGTDLADAIDAMAAPVPPPSPPVSPSPGFPA